MKLPSRAEIEALYEKYRTPRHVVEHCEAVEAVAEQLGAFLREHGVSVEIELVKAAAALHDLVRVVDFKIFEPEKFRYPASTPDADFMAHLRERYKGYHHADAGAMILDEEGFPEIADIVRKHKYRQIIEGFSTLEEKIVYYADKRVNHAEIVPLQKRLDAGRARNAPETIGSESGIELDEKVHALEAELCGLAGIAPEELRP